MSACGSEKFSFDSTSDNVQVTRVFHKERFDENTFHDVLLLSWRKKSEYYVWLSRFNIIKYR